MKRYIITTLIVLALNPTTYAHKEWVHQYILQQAYWLLQHQYTANGGNMSDLMEIKNKIFKSDGTPFYGKSAENGWAEFDSQFGLALGVWTEDVNDPIYGYKDNTFTSTGEFCATVSQTHFWKADDGYDETHPNGALTNVQNAWMKARKMLNNSNIQIGFSTTEVKMGKFTAFGEEWIPVYYKSMDLINLYHGKPSVYWHVPTRSPFPWIGTGWSVKLSTPTCPKLAYNLLGRILHLLQDMTVPAHAHNHIHPCPIDFPDRYEDGMGGTFFRHGQSNCSDDPGGVIKANNLSSV
jgi:hypothetical protein